MDLFLTSAGDDFRNFRDDFIQHVRRDCRTGGNSRREPAKLQSFIRIRCERIASHLQKLRVDRVLTGNAIACEPSKIVSDFIKYVPDDAHFLGEMIHSVGQPFDVLGTSWLRGRCCRGFLHAKKAGRLPQKNCSVNGRRTILRLRLTPIGQAELRNPGKVPRVAGHENSAVF